MVIFSPSGHASLFDVESQSLVHLAQRSSDSPHAHATAAFSPDKAHLVLGTASGNVGLQVIRHVLRQDRIATGAGINRLLPSVEDVQVVACSPDGQHLVLRPGWVLLGLGRSSDSRPSRITLESVEDNTGHELPTTITYTPDGERLVIAFVDNSIGIWDTSSGNLYSA